MTYAQVKSILSNRCQECHSQTPQQEGLYEAPKGVKFDTAADIISVAPRIMQQAVVLKAMPPGNVTHITEEERAKIGAWIQAGAKGP